MSNHQEKPPLSVVIAGGGTGGHVYPALAIAQALKQKSPHTKIYFIGSPKGLEARVIPEAGFPLKLISIGRFNRNVALKERIKTFFQIPWAVVSSLVFLLKVRPSIVFGVGGYVSAPPLIAAILLRKKVFIWEPNAFPGMVNRRLAPFVTKVLFVMDGALKYMKSKRVQKVGVPVRQEIEALFREDYKPRIPPLHFFVFGGSQGAHAINKAIVECFQQYPLESVKLIHQTGQKDYDWVLESYKELDPQQERLKCFAFVKDMDEKYRWSHLVMCRSGIGSVFEILATGRPAILVPYPYAADNHQQKNAEELEAKGAAWVLLEKDLSPEKIFEFLDQCIKKPDSLVNLSLKAKTLYKQKAADEIAQMILSS
ncbi:MAG: undecaprenyldiphospho-muramoylpentapeptide beta-N-acetylglucosaminyltransferase [Bdellovibrio sp.]|nr:MAG: undecaprenyldiphospho-muramoylpentapeptide beta-N-acetylglucosaminyltransferase [Bdellovibrio sp.]